MCWYTCSCFSCLLFHSVQCFTRSFIFLSSHSLFRSQVKSILYCLLDWFFRSWVFPLPLLYHRPSFLPSKPLLFFLSFSISSTCHWLSVSCWLLYFCNCVFSPSLLLSQLTYTGTQADSIGKGGKREERTGGSVNGHWVTEWLVFLLFFPLLLFYPGREVNIK